MRHRLIIASVGLAVVLGAYSLGRLQGPSPGASAATGSEADVRQRRAVAHADAALPVVPPAAGTARLRDSFDRLQARADAGDVAAAVRLYRDLSICNRIRDIDGRISGMTEAILGRPVEALTPEQLRRYRAKLDVVASNERNMRELHRMCDGASQAMRDSLVPNLRRAAMLGDAGARACYLARGPGYDARALVRHPERLRTYRASVATLVEAGIAAGDWRVVDLLRDAYRPGADSLLAGALGTDPDRYYRYLKLYRLGAEPYRAEALDRQVAAAAAALDPVRLAEADAWAETAFLRRFDGGNSTESTVQGWDPCAFAHE